VHTRTAHAAGISAGIFGTALLAMLLGPAPAFADEVPGGAANFAQAGARVYPLDAVGIGCRLFGRCGGAADELDRRGVPEYLSLHAGEGVGAACRAGALVQVRGFFTGGDELSNGWAHAGDVTLRRPLDEC